MQALYELSSDRDLSLNKTAQFKKEAVFSPSLSGAVSPKQAMAAMQKTKEEDDAKLLKASPDPLLQEREKDEIEMKKAMVQPKHATVLAKGRSNYGAIPRGGSQNQHHPAVTPRLARYAERPHLDDSPPLHRNNTMDDSGMEEMDDLRVRRTGSGGLVLADRRQRSMPSDPVLSIDTEEDSLIEERERLEEANAASSRATRSSLATGRSSYGTLQRQGSKNWHHSAMTPSLQKYAKPVTPDHESSTQHPQKRGIYVNKTFDDADDYTTPDELSIKRTGSGGLMMLHTEEKKETKKPTTRDAFNMARALEMQALLENNSQRDLSLNRVATFKKEPTFSPSLHGSVASSPTAAFQAYQKQRSEDAEKRKNDPLLMGHKKREQEERDTIALTDAKKDIRATATSGGKSPRGGVQQKSSQHGYKASNGKVYDLPTMC